MNTKSIIGEKKADQALNAAYKAVCDGIDRLDDDLLVALVEKPPKYFPPNALEYARVQLGKRLPKLDDMERALLRAVASNPDQLLYGAKQVGAFQALETRGLVAFEERGGFDLAYLTDLGRKTLRYSPTSDDPELY